MPRLRFGLFDFNSTTGELFRDGLPVHLQAQPAKLLALLLAGRGEIVTRESLREALWPDGTFVDFDKSLNFAIAQVRTALGDSADSPRFVRTVPKRGYQFIAPVTESQPDAPQPDLPQPALSVPPPPASASNQRWHRVAATVLALALAALAAAAVWKLRPKETRIAVARFQNETGNPALDRFTDTFTDSFVASLTTQTAGRIGVIGNDPILRNARRFQDLDIIANALNAHFVIVGQVQQDGPQVRVLAHLIQMPQKTHLDVARRNADPNSSNAELADAMAGQLARILNSPKPATN